MTARIAAGPRRQAVAAAAAVLLLLAAFGTSLVLYSLLSLTPGPNEYNIVSWVVRSAPGKWLYLAGDVLRDDLSEGQQDALLHRFFELSGQIEAMQEELTGQAAGSKDLGRLALLDSLRTERDGIENDVEAIIESRLTTVIAEEGLTRSLIFDVVWPPVDTEFTEAPRMLAVSPRDRIELTGTTLLREDLSLEDLETIEAETEQRDGVAARAFSLGGVGAYPTLIDFPRSYERALEVVAHEWMHNYLFFRPLGFNYYTSNELRTINETVADLAGRELARRVMERWPLTQPGQALEQTPEGAAPEPEGRQPDLGTELRRLRSEVDGLLAEGRIEAAEALMEARRLELAEQGFFIRKINQAYFAYLNLYAGEAGSPAATNPIGPKVDELRRRSGGLKQFVDIVGDVTSVAELDEALASFE